MASWCPEPLGFSCPSNRRRTACGGEPTVVDQRARASSKGLAGEDIADGDRESAGENASVIPVAREKAVQSDSHVVTCENPAENASAGGSA